jgi:aminoglycoside 3-N-acetyltransferase
MAFKESLKEELKKEISKIIGLEKQEINYQSELGLTYNWDSLKHMEIVLMVQEKYGLDATPDDIIKMKSFGGICDVVSSITKNSEKKSILLNEKDFINALVDLGLTKGDHIFVQSSIGNFGKIKNPLETIKDAFLTVIGDKGTLAVPTFNFCFCRGEDFDMDKTESEMGQFSEFIRISPESLRSQHPPFHSVATLGKYAMTLSNVMSKTSFSWTSVFGKMYDLDFKICMLGTSMQHNTFFHYVEEQVGVPYRFFKTFTATIKHQDKIEKRSYNYYARDLDLELKFDFHGVGEKILYEINGKKTTLGFGVIYLFPCRKLVDITAEYLSKDPSFLVREKDKWKIKKMNSRVR